VIKRGRFSMAPDNPISFSMVTGASSGIGLELARVAAEH
jgi:NADP-dependent 3-hydroxy acid dehydrogenase YdfG